MNKILLLLCILASWSMMGQNFVSNGLQTQFTENWVDGAWQNSKKETWTTNSEGYYTNKLTEVWNAETSVWETDSQEIFTYEGSAWVSTFQIMENGNWVNFNKTTWYYNNNGQADTMILQTWTDGEWQDHERKHFTYNNDGHLINVLIELGPVWYIWEQSNYTLNEEGLPSIVLTQRYDPTIQEWTDDLRETDTYTNGLMTYSLYEVKLPDWINVIEITRDFDMQGRTLEELYKSWQNSTSSWETSLRITYNYGTLGEDTFNKNIPVLYPNPADEVVSISSGYAFLSVSAYDIAGRNYPLELAGNNVNVSALPAGIYILTAETESGVARMKLIKK